MTRQHLSATDKEFEASDPLELAAMAVEGDPTAMLDGLIEEYLRLGWNDVQIEALFASPVYAATYSLGQRFGKDRVRERIAQKRGRCGIFRVQIEAESPVHCPATALGESGGPCHG